MKWFVILVIVVIVLIAAGLSWFLLSTSPQRFPTTNTTPTDTTSPDVISSDNAETMTTDNSDAHSCDQDFITYCQGTPPGKINLVNCLLNEHYDEISDACRNSLERRQQLNEELVAACEIERAKFCQGVEPKVGSEPMVDCLGEHYAQLSAECVVAYDAHEAAKLTK